MLTQECRWNRILGIFSVEDWKGCVCVRLYFVDGCVYRSAETRGADTEYAGQCVFTAVPRHGGLGCRMFASRDTGSSSSRIRSVHVFRMDAAAQAAGSILRLL